MRFLESIAAVEGIKLTPQEEEKMKDSLSLLIPGFESLTSYSNLLKGMDHSSSFVSALSNYTLGGIWGLLFDSEDDGLNVESWPQITTIELNSLMDMGNKAIIPALTYIFSQLDELFEDMDLSQAPCIQGQDHKLAEDTEKVQRLCSHGDSGDLGL